MDDWHVCSHLDHAFSQTMSAGQIWFDNVRVPREDMLDGFASVAPDGAYTSDVLLDFSACFARRFDLSTLCSTI